MMRSAILILFVIPALSFATDAKKEKLVRLFASELVSITPGEGKFPAAFEMGSDGEADEKPIHKVTLKKPFAVAKYEVTQELYEAIMGENPSKWKGPRNSVEMVDWDEANTFCRKLTEAMREMKLLKKNEVIRLPTEAEWEYCCRAGTKTAFSFGEGKKIDDYAWHRGNSKGEDPPVGAKKPNPWGLYDMHGYLWEWCLDNYHESYEGAPADGSAWASDKGKGRVLRSGAWDVMGDQCRSASRWWKPKSFRDDAVGLRCVKSVEN